MQKFVRQTALYYLLLLPIVSHAGTCRLVIDSIIYYGSVGFFGKPAPLRGIKTQGVVWGIHDLKNVFTHLLGIRVGGGPLVGFHFFEHPYGNVDMSGSDRFISIDVATSVSYKAIRRESLAAAVEANPGLSLTDQDFHTVEIDKYDPQTNRRERSLHINIPRSEGETIPQFRARLESLMRTLFP